MRERHRVYASGWVRAIAEATDHDTAMRFVLTFNGRRIRIPKVATPGGQLARGVGLEAAEAIVARLAETEFQVPTELKNLVHWLSEQGKSGPEIAHIVHRSRRWVSYLLNGNMPERGTLPGDGADDLDLSAPHREVRQAGGEVG